MEVRGELGLFPLSIEIYTRMMKYLFHLRPLLKEGNLVIRDAIPECKKIKALLGMLATLPWGRRDMLSSMN